MTRSSAEIIDGVLIAHWETGTEGVRWALQESDKPDYDGLHILHPGDRLIVLGEDGVVIWEGLVDLEFERRWQPFPANPSDGQQEIFGFWVHGFQKGLAPARWARFFFDGHPAKLVRVGRGAIA